jgi:hypothetical protein
VCRAVTVSAPVAAFCRHLRPMHQLERWLSVPSYSAALGTPYRSALPAGCSGARARPSRTASLTFRAVAPLIWWQGHGSQHQRAGAVITAPVPQIESVARGIKLPNVAAVQCPHDADPSKHCGPSERHHQDQPLARRCGGCQSGGMRSWRPKRRYRDLGRRQHALGNLSRRTKAPTDTTAQSTDARESRP